jgi:type IV pilus assembly protein PilC
MNAPAPAAPHIDADRWRLAWGLEACAREMSFGPQRRQLWRLSRRLLSGEALTDLLGPRSRVSPELKEMLASGLECGRLPQVLEEYVRTTREVRSIWRALWISLLYPALVAGVAALILGGFLALTVPTMRNIFEGFGVQLPGVTVLVLNLAELLFEYWPLLIAASALSAGCVVLILCDAWFPGRTLVTRLLQRLPVIGTAWRSAAAVEFCSRLSVLIEARMTLPRALQTLSRSLRDAPLRGISAGLARRLENGETVETLAVGVPGMLHTLAGAFRWAHDPDGFADGLRALATVFAAQARVRVDQIAFLVAPLSFVLVGLGGGILVLSYFLPLIKLLNDLM